MSNYEEVKQYIKARGLKLDTSEINANVRVTAYMCHNRLLETINTDNRSYRTMRDLIESTKELVREVREDFKNLVYGIHSDLYVTEAIRMVAVVKELDQIDLTDYSNSLVYFKEVAFISVYALNLNPDLKLRERQFFEILTYISVEAINLINKVGGNPPFLEGVEVNFGKSRV